MLENSESSDRELTLTTTPVGSAVVVAVDGELDLLTARELLATVDDLQQRDEDRPVIIDLTKVSFLGSAGLGVMAELATRAIAAPRLRVVAPPDQHAVTRPWEVMNMQQILPLYPSIADALAAG